MAERILLVDDDPEVREALRRTLERWFTVDTASSGDEALERLEDQAYALIVSDQQMPGMDGVQLLTRVRELCPATVRLMLTASTDQRTAIEAVNRGHIYQFLTKPWTVPTLIAAIEAGLQQYRLAALERELLQNTLRGSVKLLTDLLALSNPAAFSQATRVTALVRQMLRCRNLHDAWEIEVAAMLSPLGCATLPPALLDKVRQGQGRSPAEQQLFQRHPDIARRLIANIPRLEGVAHIVACQLKQFDGAGPPEDVGSGDAIPLGSRMLKIASDYDLLQTAGVAPGVALVRMRERHQVYDPQLLDVLAAVLVAEATTPRDTALPAAELRAGMVLAEDVVSTHAQVVVARGTELNEAVCERLRAFAQVGLLREPLRVFTAGA